MFVSSTCVSIMIIIVIIIVSPVVSPVAFPVGSLEVSLRVIKSTHNRNVDESAPSPCRDTLVGQPQQRLKRKMLGEHRVVQLPQFVA